MGFNFRKSLKIAPGVRVNLTKKGVSSVSIGPRGAKVNIGKKGTRTTVGAPGTGLSYSSFSPRKTNTSNRQNSTDNSVNRMNMAAVPNIPPLPLMPQKTRKVSVLLAIGIFLFPYIFAWFTLRGGHSKTARYVSFGWLLFLVFLSLQNN